jgi:hypothetical protein
MPGNPRKIPPFPPLKKGGGGGIFAKGGKGDFEGGFLKGTGCPCNMDFFESLTKAICDLNLFFFHLRENM